MTKEITIYEKSSKLYCQDCKPRGGKRGTLVVGCYDSFCAGCGEDFLEMAEDAASLQEAMAQPTLGPFTLGELCQVLHEVREEPPAIMLTGLFDAPCSRCHLPTKGRCQGCNVPLCMLCVNTGRGECLVCHVRFVREQEALQHA